LVGGEVLLPWMSLKILMKKFRTKIMSCHTD
jgi:hypothetical protein